jgi:hypothetical protein
MPIRSVGRHTVDALAKTGTQPWLGIQTWASVVVGVWGLFLAAELILMHWIRASYHIVNACAETKAQLGASAAGCAVVCQQTVAVCYWGVASVLGATGRVLLCASNL